MIGCIKWRSTKNDDPNGPPDHAKDKSCTEQVGTDSGYCQCKNGLKAMKKGRGLPESYGYSYNSCEEACHEKGK